MSGPSSVFALLDGIRALPVVAIDAVEDAVPLADALAEGGLPAIEVTLRTAAAFDAIAKLQKERPEAADRRRHRGDGRADEDLRGAGRAVRDQPGPDARRCWRSRMS